MAAVIVEQWPYAAQQRGNKGDTSYGYSRCMTGAFGEHARRWAWSTRPASRAALVQNAAVSDGGGLLLDDRGAGGRSA